MGGNTDPTELCHTFLDIAKKKQKKNILLLHFPGHEDLLKEFPEPKNLLHKTVSRLLGLSDLSKHLKYCCTEVGGNVKVSVLWYENKASFC